MLKINKIFSMRKGAPMDRKRQGRIRFLLDKSPLPSWIRDKAMVLQYCNFAYADAFDTTPEFILEKQMIFYTEGGDPHALARSALERDAIQSTTTTVIVGGKRRLYEITEIPTLDGEAVVGYASDYTAIEDLQSSLERHIQASQDIYEFLGSAVAIFGSGRTLQFFNHAFVQMWKLEQEWLSQGPSIGEFLDQLRKRRMIPESLDFQNTRHEYLAMFTSLLEPKQALWHLPDEQTIKITIIPHPLGGIFFSYENVTDRLALERNYKSLLSVHESVMQDLEEGLVIWGSDGRIRTMNEACRVFLSLEKTRDVYEGMRLYDITETLKLLLVRRLPPHRWPAFQKRLLGTLMRQSQRRGIVRLNSGMALRYAFRPLPDGAFLLSFVNGAPQVQEGVPKDPLTKGDPGAEPPKAVEKIMKMAPALEMMDAIIPMFQGQFQYKATSISLSNTAGQGVMLPQELFEDTLKTLLSLIVLCVKVKSEVVMALKLLRGYVVLNITFTLSKESFHLLPRDLRALPGITSLVRQYSQHIKLDVELAEGDILKLSLAFFPNHPLS
jgi:PAS domain-containing protein